MCVQIYLKRKTSGLVSFANSRVCCRLLSVPWSLFSLSLSLSLTLCLINRLSILANTIAWKLFHRKYISFLVRAYGGCECGVQWGQTIHSLTHSQSRHNNGRFEFALMYLFCMDNNNNAKCKIAIKRSERTRERGRRREKEMGMGENLSDGFIQCVCEMHVRLHTAYHTFRSVSFTAQ